MTIIDENGDFPSSSCRPLAPELPAPSRACFREAVAIEGDGVAGLAVVLERVRARVGAAPARYGSVCLAARKRPYRVGRAQALDLAAVLLELADALRAAGMVLEGLALEGLQARVLESLVGSGP
jgi:hypothetical protein